MKILVGSYKTGIYEVTIDENKKKFHEKRLFNNLDKASYLINDLDLSYIYSKDNFGYVKVGNDDVLLTESATHLSYDNINEAVYVSFYGAGLLKVLRKNSIWKVDETISYPEGSHIHYASYIPSVNLLGVVDLGHNKVYFYENKEKLTLKNIVEFDQNFGPRHFINHPSLPIIYLLSELVPTIHVLMYKDDTWVEIDRIQLEKGAGSAIRVTNDGKHLFAAVRFSNLLYHFNIKDDGNLVFNNVYKTLGDHPRDFNLISDDKYLVIANMHSDNLTLFELVDNKLVLRDSDYFLNHGASIIHYK